MPNLAVIVPIFNAEEYLEKAIDSILNQSYSNFELIAIDDGSTDRSLDILKGIQRKDSRVRVVSRENRGLVSTLNEGLSLVSSDVEYVARMDADDISKPSRFEEQMSFLKSNQDIAVLGTSYEYIDMNDNVVKIRILPTNKHLLKVLAIFGSPLCHPSVMFNFKILGEDLYYEEAYSSCEDLELWLRLIGRGYTISNITSPLFRYRLLASSISSKNGSKQCELSLDLRSGYIGGDKEKVRELRSDLFLRRLSAFFSLMRPIFATTGLIGLLFSFAYIFKTVRNVRD
ncbi:glycosyltransferase family 2 protein [Vibrio mediterranei]